MYIAITIAIYCLINQKKKFCDKRSKLFQNNNWLIYMCREINFAINLLI